MVFSRKKRVQLIAVLAVGLLTSSCWRHKKYEHPIANDSKQPDKVLFDKAIDDIEHGRYEVARITLNTLINTYDQSEYLAKSKLAIADSWYREGGAHGYAQAEAEYKDFILFYPTMEESAEAQNRVCMIHYNQMEKPDRDAQQALRAEDECRQLLVQFPNSRYAKEAAQRLRNIQEGIAEGEFRTGFFYYKKGSNPAAANRFSRLVDQYPLYSKSDEALWLLGDAYSRMGNRFRAKAGDAYGRIVREYPLSSYAADAKSKLEAMELPVPQADPAALARMKFDQEHPVRLGLMRKTFGFMAGGPDFTHAAQNGTPSMSTVQPTVPVSVPLPAGAAGTGGFNGDVTVSQVGSNSALDTKPDARLGGQQAGTNATAASGGNTAQAGEAPQVAKTPANGTGPAAASNEPLPVNHPMPVMKKKKKSKKQKNADTQQAAPATATNSNEQGSGSSQAQK